MKKIKFLSAVAVFSTLIFVTGIHEVDAQILKKLQKKAANAATKKLENKSETEANKAMDNVLDDNNNSDNVNANTPNSTNPGNDRTSIFSHLRKRRNHYLFKI